MSKKLKQDISIGENLKNLRKQANLSQEELAAQLQLMGISISREMISQMELGSYSIRISILLALKTLYKIEWNAFFDGIALPPTP